MRKIYTFTPVTFVFIFVSICIVSMLAIASNQPPPGAKIKGPAIIAEITFAEETVMIDNEPVVLVADECNGLELFVLYAGFIICFPGKIKFKLIFIPIGILLIYFVNVIREIVLALNYKFFRESFEFNHKYTYVLIVYIFVFILWRIWIKRYSIIAEKVSNE